MLGAIKYGLVNLLNFKGRDARTTFWYFVLFIMILRTVISFAITLPMMAQMMIAPLQAAANGTNPEAVQLQAMAGMLSSMSRIMWISVTVALVSSIMLLGSIVRRLHDGGYSGWLAAIPGLIYAAGIAQAPGQMQKMAEVFSKIDSGAPPNPFAMMQGQGLLMLLTWIPLFMVIAIGLLKSTPGPNLYGEEPVYFR